MCDEAKPTSIPRLFWHAKRKHFEIKNNGHGHQPHRSYNISKKETKPILLVFGVFTFNGWVLKNVKPKKKYKPNVSRELRSQGKSLILITHSSLVECDSITKPNKTIHSIKAPNIWCQHVHSHVPSSKNYIKYTTTHFLPTQFDFSFFHLKIPAAQFFVFQNFAQSINFVLF